jgi:hypothetical protein
LAFKTCKICSREYSDWAHLERHPELCIECGNRAQRFLKAAYVLTGGQTGVRAEIAKVSELVKTKTDNELDDMIKETKKNKYAGI